MATEDKWENMEAAVAYFQLLLHFTGRTDKTTETCAK
jgi:hypothetical protein